MNIKDVKYVDVVSESEDEYGYYNFITSYERISKGKFKKTYKSDHRINNICPNCGMWNITDNHSCDNEYTLDSELVEEINDIYGDNSIRIYINKVLV